MAGSTFFSLDGPLDASPARHQMRAANFSGFADYVRRRDADPRRILEKCGLEYASIQTAEHHIDMQALVDVFEHCADVFDDRLFGLRLSQGQAANVFDRAIGILPYRARPGIRRPRSTSSSSRVRRRSGRRPAG